jgi:uncharacterized protein
MRLSVFNHYVSDYPEIGQTLINNTFSGAYVVLETDVLDALRKQDRGEALSADEAELTADPELRDPDVALVVESRAAEEAEFAAWFERRRDTGVLDCIVGVNLACNFDCPYCSQATIMDGTVMKPEVADATARWLAERAVSAGLDRIHLAFVGGEPLLHPERIERIARGVREHVGPEGPTLTFTLITNGYFLDQAMVQRLLPLGLEHAKVTIDGDQTTHRTTRVSKRGEDTFQRIFDNVIAASKHIRINLNGNYQTDTVHGFEPLITQLADAGLTAGSKLSFSPALEALSTAEGVGSGSCTWSGSDMSQHVRLHDLALTHGFSAPPLDLFGPCELHERHAYAIEPSGIIYKCPGFLGHPEWGIGNVAGDFDEQRYQHILGLTPKQEPCGGCSNRPNCGGGCLAAEWLKSGSTDGVNCEKPYFARVERDAVVRGYVLLTEDEPAAALAALIPDSPHPAQPRQVHLRVIAA